MLFIGVLALSSHSLLDCILRVIPFTPSRIGFIMVVYNSFLSFLSKTLYNSYRQRLINLSRPEFYPKVIELSFSLGELEGQSANLLAKPAAPHLTNVVRQE